MTLESYIRGKCSKKDILIMTHIVMGYPTLEESFQVIETMVDTLSIQQKADHIGEQLRAEDGIGTAVRFVETVAGG